MILNKKLRILIPTFLMTSLMTIGKLHKTF